MNAWNISCQVPKQLAFAAAWIFLLVFSVTARQEEIISVKTELVNLNVVVVDRQGHPVSGLAKEDFEVYEDGKRQKITHFSAGERPVRLVLLFDTSISMKAVLPQVRREAGVLIDKLRPRDEVSVVSFASEIRAHSDWLKPEQAKPIIAGITPEAHPQPMPASAGRNGYRIGDGNTNLYEALQYTLTNFRAESGDRIAVVVFSDGVDTAAGRSVNRTRERAEESAARFGDTRRRVGLCYTRSATAPNKSSARCPNRRGVRREPYGSVHDLPTPEKNFFRKSPRRAAEKFSSGRPGAI